MSETNTSQIDIAPLTLVVSEALDPRVRRKLEAEQQADVKTYKEFTRSLEVQEDLNKIRQEVEKDGEETDPFKTPDASENESQQSNEQAEQPTEAQNPAPADNADAGNTDNQADAGSQETQNTDAQGGQENQQPKTGTETSTNTGANPPEGSGSGQGNDEDLSSAFEGFGTQTPKDLLRRVVKDYIKMESSDTDDVGELQHIKSLVYIDLSENAVEGDTLESVQTLRDPENTIVVINEESIPDADTIVRARRIAEQLADRGVKVFYDLEEAVDYLNQLYDIVSGRSKEA